MTALVIRGDARHLPLPDACVDLIVTSPPYFALRSYSDVLDCLKCYEMRLNGRDPRQAWPDYAAHVRDVHERRHYPGQIGSEPTPQEFLEALWECTAEMMRVLKPTGSAFINLGDKYSGAPSGPQGATAVTGPSHNSARNTNGRRRVQHGIPEKSLMLLPERYRIGCVDRLGLIARAVIVWSKVNGLPESVTDRVRRSHEDWVHLTKRPRYYSAVDEIRAPAVRTDVRKPAASYIAGVMPGSKGHNGLGDCANHPLGSLPGSVWQIPTEPLTVPDHLGIDHFAAYPTEWPKRWIRGWSPPGICLECGEGRRPVADRSYDVLATRSEISKAHRTLEPLAKTRMYDQTMAGRTTILGWVCACTPHTDHPGTGEPHRNNSGVSGGNAGKNITQGAGRLSDLGSAERVGPWREYHFDRWTPAPTRPAIILDPFGGTGTTALVASALGRIGIGVDLSHDYCRLAQWRTTDRAQIAKVLEVPKPPVIPKAQLGFDFGDAS